MGPNQPLNNVLLNAFRKLYLPIALVCIIGAIASYLVCFVGSPLGFVINIAAVVLSIVLILLNHNIIVKSVKKEFGGSKRIPGKIRRLLNVYFPLGIAIIITSISIFVNAITVYVVSDNEVNLVESLLRRKEDQEIIDNNNQDNKKNNQNYSTKYEGDILVEFALSEYAYYNSNGIKGGKRYWDWLDNTGSKPSDPGHWAQNPLRGYGWEWCATFVTYCVDNCDLDSSTGPFKNLMTSKYNLKSCTEWNRYFTNYLGLTAHSNAKEYAPQPGDIALFKKVGGFSHIGIVEKTVGNKVYTIEGNTSGTNYTTTVVSSKSYTIGEDGKVKSGLRTLIFFHPNYRNAAITENGLEYTENNGAYQYSGAVFNIEGYNKGSDGYYSASDVEKLVFDYLMIELGYNQAAACGVLANLEAESGFKYDKVECANWGKAYVSASNSVKFYNVPSGSANYNGNYKNISDIRNTLLITDKLYYEKSDHSGFIKYGMGYGLVQWSFARRVYLLDELKSNNMDIGPDSILGQLIYLKKELTDSDFCSSKQLSSYPVIVHKKLVAVSNTEEGAKEAARIWAAYFEVCGVEFRPGRVTRAIGMWSKYGNRQPQAINAMQSNGAESNNGNSTINIGSTTVIGDSNTYRMASNNTSISNAKNVLAISGVGVGNYKDYTNDACTNSCKGKTLEKAINSLTPEDLSSVTIMLGTNDFYSGETEFKKNYKSLLDTIKAKNSNASVVICTILPVNENASSSIKNADANKINEYIKKVAVEYTGLNIKVLDVNKYMTISDMSTVNGDGYHLSIAGCSKCSDYIAKNCFSSGNVVISNSNGGDPAKEDYIFPVNVSKPIVNSNVGERHISNGSRIHYGIDIAVGKDTDVLAVKSGIVIQVGWDNFRGYYVTISHGPGVTSLYQHLHTYSVKAGDRVTQGQVIAKSGNTGYSIKNGGPVGYGSYGYHLHFELMVGGKVINPLVYLPNIWVKAWSGNAMNLDFSRDPRAENRNNSIG